MHLYCLVGRCKMQNASSYAGAAGLLSVNRELEVLPMLDNVVPTTSTPSDVSTDTKSHGTLDADIIIKNAPDPSLVNDWAAYVKDDELRKLTKSHR